MKGETINHLEQNPDEGGMIRADRADGEEIEGMFEIYVGQEATFRISRALFESMQNHGLK